MGRKSVKSVLWVSADGLRVVDDKTKVGACEGGSRHQWATVLSLLEWAKDAFPPTSKIALLRDLLDYAMGSWNILAHSTVIIQDWVLWLFVSWHR